nr:MAG TPA: hypothetical protein [Caudoviricetes sp.]
MRGTPLTLRLMFLRMVGSLVIGILRRGVRLMVG